ncbi:MAG: peptidylprolyl isomerase [Bacteroidota bacterium]|nr:peptidylprolyl isomerase [Bacteroidota bacterium]MDX5427696.1 peptidylprolyl isomerase [Bacteroidota bacterium]MDX5505593.1 peptidylprolyl isomerase [Bacteroidota bacterium]
MLKRLSILFVAIAAVSIQSCSLFGSKTVKVNDEKIELKDGIYAKMTTTKGDILIQLAYQKAPMTVANFVLLAQGEHPKATVRKGQPFYDGLIFHRVIPKFMIQGGDPAGNGSGDPGYSFPDEFNSELRHDTAGILSMANSGPNTNGSQFFITHVPTPHLDDRHSVFGRVISGQSVVDGIADVEKNAQNKPKVDVVLEKVEIIRVGQEAKDWDALTAFNTGLEEAEARMAEEKRKMEEEKARQAKIMEEQLAQFKGNAKATESGLMYIPIVEGTGPQPKVGDQVKVHYVGKFLDGQIFDTSIKDTAKEYGVYDQRREPYDPFTVQYGPGGRVIPGWVEGLQLMNVGDRTKLIIPPHLAYGQQGIPGAIPGNAYLIFDVQLVEIAK